MPAEVKFLLGDKAESLYFSVLDETSNRKHFPVKYHRLVDFLQNCAWEIYGSVMDANSYRPDVPEQRVKRNELFTHAVTQCNKFMSLVKYCLRANRIGFSLGEQWTALTVDIKFMALSLRR